ncbi:MAG: hypothetical protein M1826_007137 [Phylliscum demangeonii]|nr:MAG: hypothetical protein M1826_007137 [Phylliscum demangeonii]
MTSSTSASLQQNYRLINVDRFDAEAAINFDLTTLIPAAAAAGTSPGATPWTATTAQQLAAQHVRPLLRSGDAEAALRAALDGVRYGAAAEEGAKEVHLATVMEVLQSIKQTEMTPLLTRIYPSAGGVEALDVLMKYLSVGRCAVAYKGMAALAPPPAPSSLLLLSSSSLSSAPAPRKSLTPQSTGGGYYQSLHARAAAADAGAGVGAGAGAGAGMSVLLSWHEKVVEIAGVGSIVRVMTDRRLV